MLPSDVPKRRGYLGVRRRHGLIVEHCQKLLTARIEGRDGRSDPVLFLEPNQCFIR